MVLLIGSWFDGMTENILLLLVEVVIRTSDEVISRYTFSKYDIEMY